LSENIQDQGQIIGRILPFLEPAENYIYNPTQTFSERMAYMSEAEQNR
jgi:hypothetical protein